MRKSNYIYCLIILFCYSSGVLAENERTNLSTTENILPTAPDDNADDSVARTLTRLKSEVLVLNAQAKKAEALKRLNDVSGSKIHLSSEPVIPKIKSIFGKGSTLLADVECADGNVVEVKAGDKNVCGMEIIKITNNKVSMRLGSTSYNVPLQHNTQATASENGSASKNSNYIPKPRFK